MHYQFKGLEWYNDLPAAAQYELLQYLAGVAKPMEIAELTVDEPIPRVHKVKPIVTGGYWDDQIGYIVYDYYDNAHPIDSNKIEIDGYFTPVALDEYGANGIRFFDGEMCWCYNNPDEISYYQNELKKAWVEDGYEDDMPLYFFKGDLGRANEITDYPQDIVDIRIGDVAFIGEINDNGSLEIEKI